MITCETEDSGLLVKKAGYGGYGGWHPKVCIKPVGGGMPHYPTQQWRYIWGVSFPSCPLLCCLKSIMQVQKRNKPLCIVGQWVVYVTAQLWTCCTHCDVSSSLSWNVYTCSSADPISSLAASFCQVEYSINHWNVAVYVQLAWLPSPVNPQFYSTLP